MLYRTINCLTISGKCFKGKCCASFLILILKVNGMFRFFFLNYPFINLFNLLCNTEWNACHISEHFLITKYILLECKMEFYDFCIKWWSSFLVRDSQCQNTLTGTKLVGGFHKNYAAYCFSILNHKKTQWPLKISMPKTIFLTSTVFRNVAASESCSLLATAELMLIRHIGTPSWEQWEWS